MKFITSKSKDKFEIVHDDKVILSGLKPKWFSSQIKFSHNEVHYEIKKSNFWGTSFQVTRDGLKIGEIKWNWKKGHILYFKDENDASVTEYWLKSENSKGWLKADKKYSLNNVKEKPTLNIHYGLKKWKPEIHLEFLETENFPLLMCAIFLMWQKQNTESSAAGAMVGG